MYVTFTWDPIHTYTYCTRSVYVNNACYVNLCADLYCIYWTILYHHCRTRTTQVDVVWFCWISIRQSLNNIRASVCTANWKKPIIFAGKMHVLELRWLSEYMYVMLLMKTGVLELRSDWCCERWWGWVTVAGVVRGGGGLVTVAGVAGGWVPEWLWMVDVGNGKLEKNICDRIWEKGALRAKR